MAVEIRLKQVRESRGLSQFELAQKTGMSPQNIQKLEQGRAKGVQLDTLDSLCNALECEIQDLLVRVPDEPVSIQVETEAPTSKRGKRQPKGSEPPMLQCGQLVKIPSGARAWVNKVLDNGRVALEVEGLGADEYPAHLLTVTDCVV